ncbi:putative malate dehydrogenase 1B [Mizuhopecten yessoensis]|uniref:Malate dehydrogenase, cytoplasmic n=1 Tax=Mizuhopecten yessoensis TaxID=6573 RepID=A0A210Q1L4_MIZYE|nr:putative malate dehydrogenase 1B [Mizuhopecten yessoensis]OWF42631.1 malate dehydrogenase 1B [Mizuhopecten yessoensis]
MAKVVIAGKADCPYYARCELLGDKLAKNLPDFCLHKIVKQNDEWEKWLKATCNERGWTHMKSPIVWRELIDRGGKGVLIGGANDFQEYAHGYYGMESELLSSDMLKISKENLQYKKEVDEEEKEFKAQSKPLHVCLTVASNPACYAMVNAISKGDVFGSKQEVALHLYDANDKMEMLEGLRMEAIDLAHGLLRDVTVESNLCKAFSNCSAIILMDEVVRNEGEDKDSWYKRNSNLFCNYAKIINDVARKNVKVLLTGDGPVNFNVFMMLQNAPNIPRQNFAGLSRMLENHTKAVIADKLKVNSSGVVNVVIWGNVSGEYYIDLETSRVHGYEGAIWGPPSFSLPTKEMIWDKQWLAKEFPELVKARKAMVEEALNHGAYMSKGAAIATMLGHWWTGSPSGEIFSLAVCSEGWYGVPDGLVYSFPVTMHPKGYWYVVEDIDLTEEVKETLKVTVQDLISEKEIMYPPPKPPTPPQGEVKVTIMEPKEVAAASEKEEEKKEESGEEGSTPGTADSAVEVDSSNEPKLETIVEEKGANDNVNGNATVADRSANEEKVDDSAQEAEQTTPAENAE